MEKLLNLKDSVHAIDTEARELWKDDGSIFQKTLKGSVQFFVSIQKELIVLKRFNFKVSKSVFMGVITY